MAANPETIRISHGAAGRPAAVADAAPRHRETPSLWRRLYKEYGSLAGFAAATTALIVGWVGREERRLFPDHGLGYALGIAGSFLLLSLLLYPLRKKFRALSFLGNVRNWFKTHMIIGVVAPITILYHSNFYFGSVNSTAALASMLLVAVSGLVGRYLYGKVHHGLFGRKANLKELLGTVRLSVRDAGPAAQFVPSMMQAIAAFDRQVLQPPKGLIDTIVLPFRLGVQTRLAYWRIARLVARELDAQAASSAIVRAHRDRLLRLAQAFIREHLRRVRRVAAFVAYDKLFSLWHKIHLPFFLILIFTAIVHVVAVHAYSL
ncbi:MAG TPA: hypothetical protein VFY03_14070 [Woeseiaceae bacterium]|nr:hypothetical protein [Woeseiaceae bacterium]